MKQTKEEKQWATAVKDRDHHKCVICQNPMYVNAHHIIPKEQRGMRYKQVNGITLCPLHHRFSRTISAHQNPLAFFKWMQLHRYEQINHLISLCDIN